MNIAGRSMRSVIPKEIYTMFGFSLRDAPELEAVWIVEGPGKVRFSLRRKVRDDGRD